MNITIEDYQNLIQKTETIDYTVVAGRLQELKVLRLLHSIIGLVTETGELADIFKRHVFYGKELDLHHLQEEFGDLSWYAGTGCNAIGCSWQGIMVQNLQKLDARYPEGFTEYRALNRDLENEKEKARQEQD